MKKALLTLVLVLGTSVIALHAESSDKLIRSNVPFAFKVDHELFPAGRYEVERLSAEANEWMIRSADTKHEAVFLTEHSESLKPAEGSALTFEKVGNQEYLSGIEIQGRKENWRLPLKELDLARVHHESSKVACSMSTKS